MATKTINKKSLEEIDFLGEAATDFGNYGKTEKRCPRCGNEIILEIFGSSYEVKCDTPDCISAVFRGI